MEFGKFRDLKSNAGVDPISILHQAQFGPFSKKCALDNITQLNENKNTQSSLTAVLNFEDKKVLIEEACQKLKNAGLPITLLYKDGVTLILITNNFRLNKQTTKCFDELVSLSDINCVTKSFATAETPNVEHLDTIDEFERQSSIIVNSLAEQFKFFEENASDIEFYHDIPNNPSKLIFSLPNNNLLSLEQLFAKGYININEFYYRTEELARRLDKTLNDPSCQVNYISRTQLPFNQVWLRPEAELDLDPRSSELVLTSMFIFSNFVSPPLSLLASVTQLSRSVYKFIQHRTIKELLKVGDDPKALKEIFMSFKRHFLPYEENDLYTFVNSIIEITKNAEQESSTLLVSMNRTYGQASKGILKEQGWLSLD